MGHARKRMLSFFLTTSCNLDCSYCYTHNDSHSGQTIDPEFAKAGIDHFLRAGVPPHLRFFGPGEPTSQFDLMCSLIDYAKESFPQFKFTLEIQTNGVFSRRVRDYLADQFDYVWVSCDGRPEMQDVHRRNRGGHPSSPMLERNVRYLTEFGKGVTGIRTTITNANVYEQDKMLRYFRSLGVTIVWADPLFAAIGDPPETVDLDPMLFATEFLKSQSTADQLGITYGSILTANFDEDVIYQCRACLPMPHLTTDGYVSACDMALFGMDADHMDVFIYGWWDPSNREIVFNNDKISALRSRSVDNLVDCKTCPALKQCAGFCLGEVVNESRSLFGTKPRTCEAIRYLHAHRGSFNTNYLHLHP